MEYLMVDPARVEPDVVKNKSERLEREAFSLEIEEARVHRLASALGAKGVSAELATARENAAEMRARADKWAKNAGLTDEDIETIHREVMRQWIQEIEAAHAQAAVLARTAAELGDSLEGNDVRAHELEIVHELATEIWEEIAPPEPDPEPEPEPEPEPQLIEAPVESEPEVGHDPEPALYPADVALPNNSDLVAEG